MHHADDRSILSGRPGVTLLLVWTVCLLWPSAAVGMQGASPKLKSAAPARITRQASTLPAAQIRQAVETAIRERMPWKDEDVSIAGITFDETLSLPTGKLTYRIASLRNEDYLGRAMLALHLYVDGREVRKIWVNATISVMANVVTVVRPLGKHQHIERVHLSLERRDRADLPSDILSRLDDALGNRATRMLYPGTVLQSDMLSLPPVVKRGDMVKIMVSTRAMTITATGMAKQQGCAGERVQVVNTDSNRIVSARVIGPGAVEVDF